MSTAFASQLVSRGLLQNGKFGARDVSFLQNRRVRFRGHEKQSAFFMSVVSAGSTGSTETDDSELLLRSCPVPIVQLKKGKSRIFFAGNAIVLDSALDTLVNTESGPPLPADLLPLVDHNSNIIGWGAYNPNSKFRLRLLHIVTQDGRFDISQPLNINEMLVSRFRTAIQVRKSIGLPSEETTAYRLVNSEGDRLSGLNIDIYDNVAVIESSALWVERYRSEITAALLEAFDSSKHIVWRQSMDKLLLEGFRSDSGNLEESTEDSEAQPVVENGLKFEISLKPGQKTGHYCDQRENRKRIGQLAQGKDVLDCFSYSGGFGIHAGANGAKSVTMVDSSAPAIEAAKRNAERNEVEVEAVQDDVFDFLTAAIENERQWDLVIVDPPKYAPKVSSMPQATRKYKGLNKRALSVTRNGGLLLTCSCSRAMTGSGTFVDVIESAAKDAGKQITILGKFGAGADHPNHPLMEETKYLTAVLIAVNGDRGAEKQPTKH